MGACAETRHYARGNDHRVDRVCVLRTFLAGDPGLGKASGSREMRPYADSGSGAGLEIRYSFSPSRFRAVIVAAQKY